MRESGSSPKQIAKKLGLRPSAVAPLIRRVAAVRQDVEPAQRALLGCWISSGWSTGLDLAAVPEWAEADPDDESEPAIGELVQVLIARQERASRATVCGFLVDTYCLGVKNVTGPSVMGAGSLDSYRREFYRAYEDAPISVPIELAQQVVLGAVDYARGLGFAPLPAFDVAAVHLGVPEGPSPIGFGFNGKPFYLAGPHDNPRADLRTLEASVGAGNFDFIANAF